MSVWEFLFLASHGFLSQIDIPMIKLYLAKFFTAMSKVTWIIAFLYQIELAFRYIFEAGKPMNNCRFVKGQVTYVEHLNYLYWILMDFFLILKQEAIYLNSRTRLA